MSYDWVNWIMLVIGLISILLNILLVANLLAVAGTY
jgi:hypothetical protein